jgi:hypothetical protein
MNVTTVPGLVTGGTRTTVKDPRRAIRNHVNGVVLSDGVDRSHGVIFIPRSAPALDLTLC